MTADDLRARAKAEAEGYIPARPWPIGSAPSWRTAYADGYEAGFLAHAAQQPTWQAIREAVEASLHDTFPDHDLSPHDIFHIADAVLALYENGDEQ